MVTGLTILGGTVSAFAAANTSAPLTVTPNTGLSNGTMVAVTGTGYTPNSIGNLIECNNDPNIPQVMLGSPGQQQPRGGVHTGFADAIGSDRRLGKHQSGHHVQGGGGDHRASVRPRAGCCDVPAYG